MNTFFVVPALLTTSVCAVLFLLPVVTALHVKQCDTNGRLRYHKSLPIFVTCEDIDHSENILWLINHDGMSRFLGSCSPDSACTILEVQHVNLSRHLPNESTLTIFPDSTYIADGSVNCKTTYIASSATCQFEDGDVYLTSTSENTVSDATSSDSITLKTECSHLALTSQGEFIKSEIPHNNQEQWKTVAIACAVVGCASLTSLLCIIALLMNIRQKWKAQVPDNRFSYAEVKYQKEIYFHPNHSHPAESV